MQQYQPKKSKQTGNHFLPTKPTKLGHLVLVVLLVLGVLAGNWGIVKQEASANVIPITAQALTIKKDVAGNGADSSKKFEFTLVLQSWRDGSPLEDVTVYIYDTETDSETSVNTDANGKATFSLNSTSYAYVQYNKGDNNGYSTLMRGYYTVTEADYTDEGYTRSFTVEAHDMNENTATDDMVSGRFYSAETGVQEDIPITVTATNTREVPELTVSKTADVTTAKEGDIVPFTITVENKGKVEAQKVKVTDLLPEELEYVSDDTDGTVGDQQVDWTIDVPAESTQTITITTKIKPGAAGKIVNEVYITTDDTTITPSGSHAEGTVTIEEEPEPVPETPTTPTSTDTPAPPAPVAKATAPKTGDEGVFMGMALLLLALSGAALYRVMRAK